MLINIFRTIRLNFALRTRIRYQIAYIEQNLKANEWLDLHSEEVYSPEGLIGIRTTAAIKCYGNQVYAQSEVWGNDPSNVSNCLDRLISNAGLRNQDIHLIDTIRS